MRRLLLPLLLFFCSAALRAQAGYTLDSGAFSAAAGAGDSGGAGLRVEGTFGQAGPVGAASSEGYRVDGGYWSFAGHAAVPVLLAAGKGDADAVVLSWSGTAPEYQLFAADGCAPGGEVPLTATVAKQWTDADSAGVTLRCYRAVETAPAAPAR